MTNIHRDTSVRYSYFCNQLVVKIEAIGRAIAQDMTTKVKKSFDKVLYRPEPYPSDRDDYFFADTCYDLFQDYRMSMKV